MRQTFNLTPYRREVLNRMFESARPLTIAEAMNGRVNIMPTLCLCGWAQYRHLPPRGYVITTAGMRAIGVETVENETSQTTPLTLETMMTDEQIKYMVDRFLMWKLPEHFNPDNGISFAPTFNHHAPGGPQKREPVGTNLFDAQQATEMVRYMIEGMPR